MYTIIGADGKEYGPVTADQVRAWIVAGRADLSTRAKALGTDEWNTLGDFPEFEEGAGARQPPRFRPAAPEGVPFGGTPVVVRAAKLDVISCYERSWRLLLTNFWPLVGVTLLVMAADVLTSLVPYLKVAVQFGLAGVFMGGLQNYYLKTMRGLPAGVPDAFAGFGISIFNLFLVNMVSALVFLPTVMLYREGHLVGAVLVALPAIYLSIAFQFAYALVIDRGMTAFAALETSRSTITAQWWRVFLLSLLVIPFFVVGILCLIVGIFAAVVLVQGALLYAYEDLCGKGSG